MTDKEIKEIDNKHSKVIKSFMEQMNTQLNKYNEEIFNRVSGTAYTVASGFEYEYVVGNKKIVVSPDTLIYKMKENIGEYSLLGATFFAEVIPSLKSLDNSFDLNKKIDLFHKAEIEEYWIINWQEKVVKIYLLDFDNDGNVKYKYHKKVTEKNKDKLEMYRLLGVKVSFDELFNGV